MSGGNRTELLVHWTQLMISWQYFPTSLKNMLRFISVMMCMFMCLSGGMCMWVRCFQRLEASMHPPVLSYRWLWGTQMNAGNRTQIFCKSSVCSYPLSHCSNSIFLYLKGKIKTLPSFSWDSRSLAITFQGLMSNGKPWSGRAAEVYSLEHMMVYLGKVNEWHLGPLLLKEEVNTFRDTCMQNCPQSALTDEVLS